MHPSDDRGLVYLFIGAPALLTWGLAAFRKMRLLENIPISRVRSAAMGIVELNGRALPWKPLEAPFVALPCCWWHCIVEEQVAAGQNERKWQQVRAIGSVEPFYLEDDTGKVLIDPHDSERYVEETVFLVENDNRDRFEPVLNSWGLSAIGFFGGKMYRIREQFVVTGQPLYVMGELCKRVDYLAGRKERFNGYLEAAKRDPAKMAQADTNHDGRIDEFEWDAFRAKLEEQFLRDEAARESQVPECDRLIVRKPASETMLFSTQPRSKVLSSLYWKSCGAIVFGAGGVVAGLWWAMQRGYSPEVAAGLAACGVVLGAVLALYRSQNGGLSWDTSSS